MKLLLHTCCAPCLIYPLKIIKEKQFLTSVFFYNPNIHPFVEYKNRKDAIYSLNCGVCVLFPEYKPQEFFRAVNNKESTPERCAICWGLRLRRTAKEAKKGGFDYFSTTLLVSPYQNQDTLKELGEKIAKEESVSFFYQDFRPGFRNAHEEAKREGIYCQKYCGCIYSEIERYSKNKQ